MGIDQQIIDGRRITDAETLKVVTMVYAGYINKNIVAVLQANNCAAIGITGADGNLIQAHQRKNKEVDYGFVGDVDVINSKLLSGLLNDNFSVIVAPITHNKQGQLLNTNADTIAQEIAKAMSNFFEVHLIYSFEKAGVLKDVTDEDSVINEINPSNYIQLKEQNIIFEGMIPKLDNAFAALENGVKRIVIGNAEKLFELINGSSGTNIIHE
jgi:acetylglutamate kinase